MRSFKNFITEGRPSQQHPLEGHEYHKKTDAQLEYIAKDAHKAAEAMKGHNTTAENKYRDQANDSATVRYWRKKHGMPNWYKKKYGHMKEEVEQVDERCWPGHKPVPGKKPYSPGSCAKEDVEVEQMFDVVEEMIMDIAHLNNVDPEVIWEDFETIPDEELYEVAAWQRKEGKNPEGGLNRKGIESYRRENPGSKLSMAVTTKPSKLKPGSKAANRRKSFCARMGGMKKRLTSAKTANDPDSRINKALRKWNC
jgi:hypothetical protein